MPLYFNFFFLIPLYLFIFPLIHPKVNVVAATNLILHKKKLIISKRVLIDNTNLLSVPAFVLAEKESSRFIIKNIAILTFYVKTKPKKRKENKTKTHLTGLDLGKGLGFLGQSLGICAKKNEKIRKIVGLVSTFDSAAGLIL